MGSKNLLEPCPHCGSSEAPMLQDDSGYPYNNEGEEGFNFTVVCNFLARGCGSSSGWRTTCEDAVEAWNRRSAPQSADTDKLREAMTAWESLRANVLHGPDGLDNDQVNIILGMIDYYTPTAFTALQAPVLEVPGGWKLVPIEPTDEMYNAACHAFHAWRYTTTTQPDFTHKDSYRAMLAAAPLPAAPVQPNTDEEQA